VTVQWLALIGTVLLIASAVLIDTSPPAERR
jgi:hypothetical protein